MAQRHSLGMNLGSMCKWMVIASVCLAVTLSIPPLAKGQDITGTIAGQATDPSKAAVVGASVTVTNKATGVASKAVTSNDGEYVVALLPIGTYTVSVSKDGFKTESVPDVEVTVGSNIRVDVRLEVGARNEKVEVRAVEPLLQTNSSEVSTAIDARLAEDLPIAGRDVLRLATLGPGVIQGQTSSIQYLTDPYLGANIPVISGGRNESISFTMGGINTDNRRVGLPMEKPSLDAIEEFKVLANDYTAEYGQGDGQVIVEFRSGTNQLHGSVYEFDRNRDFNARNFFDPERAPLIYNQFGAAVGGPIVKNHTFFFANYEGIRNPSSSVQGGLFPTAAMLGGDFSNFRDSQGNVIPIYDPTTTNPVTGARTQFPGNIIPPTDLSPIATKLFTLYGAPTPSSIPAGVAENVIEPIRNNFLVDQISIKVDHHFARGDALSTRYSYNDPRTNTGNITQSAASTGDERNQIIGETWTHIFSPILLNEFRAGYVRQRNISFPPIASNKNLQSEAGITNPLPFNFIPTVFFQSDTGTPSFNQLNGFSSGGGGEVQQTYQFVDNVSWQLGHHAFKFGMDLRRQRWDTIGTQPTSGGSLENYGNFTSALMPDPTTPGNFIPVNDTGSALADFLLGQLAGVDFGTGLNHFSYRNTEASVFAQDTWRATPKLTVMLGVRWDYQGPIDEKNGRESWVLYGNLDGGICPEGCLVNDGQFGGTLDPIVNPFPGKEVIPNGGKPPDYRHFAPRVSVAYQLGHNTVFRAGFGMFFSLFGENNFPGATNPPFGSGYLILNAINSGSNALRPLETSVYPISTIYPPVPPLGQTVPGSLGPSFYFDLSNVQPHLNHTSAAIQHVFTPTLSAEIGYLGSFGRHMTDFESFNPCVTQETNPNAPCTVNPVTGNNITEYPNFASGALIYTNGITEYNAVYGKVEKRFSGGLALLSSYTYSRNFSNGSDSEGNDIFLGSSGGIFDPHHPIKHPSALDAPHRWVTSGIYELPFGRGKHFLGSASGPLNQVVGGWQISYVTAFQSGSALDLSSFGAANFVPGQEKNLRRLNFRKTGYYFDPTLFTEGPGDPIPYVDFRGAGINNWDMSFFKNFNIIERQKLQFRAEFYNIWNHGQFDTPQNEIFLPGFGQFEARNASFYEYGYRPARNVELALKYMF
jgi:hypothetical protein